MIQNRFSRAVFSDPPCERKLGLGHIDGQKEQAASANCLKLDFFFFFENYITSSAALVGWHQTDLSSSVLTPQDVSPCFAND